MVNRAGETGLRREFFLPYLSPALLACLGVGLMIHVRSIDHAPFGEQGYGEDTYREVLAHIESEYVTEVSKEVLIQGAIKGMMDTLDDYSRSYSPAEWREYQASSVGRRLGIGIEFGPLRGHVTVLRCVPGSPAAVAGLRGGDRIVKIDGRTIGEDDHRHVRSLVVGLPSTTVVFEVLGWDDETTRSVTIRRGSYKLETVEVRRIGRDARVGLLRITSFNQATGVDFRRRLTELIVGGADRFILDLRGNGGGSLPAAISVVSAFLETERVLTSVYRDSSEHYPTREGALAPTAPVVIIVNDESASASEVVSGALQDYQRAFIVGEHTFGKGLVQNVYELSTREMGIKLTAARYLTPAGRSLQRASSSPRNELERGGIVPDLVIEAGEAEERMILESWKRYRMDPRVAKALNEDPDWLTIPSDFEDPQLAAALAWVETGLQRRTLVGQ